ncbi:MAG TPA: sugar phosphate isomerase/epimerase [Candidatus Korarchaeota archaeon]|nr:sugar phosphate isomerase/epimerase [Candidatus Korarchaeota archaeon]
MPLRFGAMNNPDRDILEELRELLSLGIDYVELTVEWPGAHLGKVSSLKSEIKNILSSWDSDVVLHAPWYLEIASPYEEVRSGALKYAEALIDLAVELEAPFITLHPYTPGWLSKHREEAKKLNLEALRRLVDTARDSGVRIHVENVDHGAFSSVSDIMYLLNSLPELGMTYDIGHSYLGGVEKALSYIEKASSRILHVHAHDNFGRSDDHIPVGAGRIPWKRVLGALKRARYDGTVTLEIHSGDPEYIVVSRKKFLEYWEMAEGVQ